MSDIMFHFTRDEEVKPGTYQRIEPGTRCYPIIHFLI